ncbi:MAG: membrane protein insertase YidC [Chloroflexi bacterium]|nr:membrane protein insertase YidC [Chloroflexota bacterium]
MFDFLGIILDKVFIEPLVNILVVTYALLGHNFVLAIIAATVLVQLVTWPLTMKSLQSSKKMTALQQSDEWKSAQKKYAKDREKLSQETMRMYKEAGINPAAGCLPTLIQMPLLIAFYSAINNLLAVNPESLLDLTRHLYRSIPLIAEIAKQTIPLQSQFLWLNLAHPDPFYVMPVLVAASTWLGQKSFSTTPSADSQASAMTNQMQIMMPVMFGFFALSFPSGLAAYWIISSVVRMSIQGFTQGWAGVLPNLSFLSGLVDRFGPATVTAAVPKSLKLTPPAREAAPAEPRPARPLPGNRVDGARPNAERGSTNNGNQSAGASRNAASRRQRRRQSRR